ncbi:hypothetical protein FB45DRAFT_894137 [Roridomyces roridus]|uniref:Uncharacterized protein n=1 Tax=Roridomyces roridus TaxID=1738132 RepID=A0AAD7G0U1_9AGAR|nr:hypothetical protein FB45DRAFT_894137 [Roridomyces roridus]
MPARSTRFLAFVGLDLTPLVEAWGLKDDRLTRPLQTRSSIPLSNVPIRYLRNTICLWALHSDDLRHETRLWFTVVREVGKTPSDMHFAQLCAVLWPGPYTEYDHFHRLL